jgi:hypothetical protein
MQGMKIMFQNCVQRRLLLVLLSLFWFVGCGTFRREWRSAADGAAGTPSGRWEGRWESRQNGHSGQVRAVVKNPDESAADGRFLKKKIQLPVIYEATWGPLLRGRFAGEQKFTAEAGSSRRWRSVGVWALPSWAGGDYDYDITIRGDEWRAEYRGGGDAGTFLMRRVRRTAPLAPLHADEKKKPDRAEEHVR